jgi:hypothetical protein
MSHKIKLSGKHGRNKYMFIDDFYLAFLKNNKIHFRCGYAAIWANNGTSKGSYVFIHRLIMKASKGQIVDHINGDCLDNRLSNLRLTDLSGNQRNKKISSNNKSGYKGVSWNTGSKKWQVYITYNQKQHYIGLFKSKIEAAKAYNIKALEIFKEFAKINILV